MHDLEAQIETLAAESRKRAGKGSVGKLSSADAAQRQAGARALQGPLADGPRALQARHVPRLAAARLALYYGASGAHGSATDMLVDTLTSVVGRVASCASLLAQQRGVHKHSSKLAWGKVALDAAGLAGAVANTSGSRAVTIAKLKAYLAVAPGTSAASLRDKKKKLEQRLAAKRSEAKAKAAAAGVPPSTAAAGAAARRHDPVSQFEIPGAIPDAPAPAAAAGGFDGGAPLYNLEMPDAAMLDLFGGGGGGGGDDFFSGGIDSTINEVGDHLGDFGLFSGLMDDAPKQPEVRAASKGAAAKKRKAPSKASTKEPAQKKTKAAAGAGGAKGGAKAGAAAGAKSGGSRAKSGVKTPKAAGATKAAAPKKPRASKASGAKAKTKTAAGAGAGAATAAGTPVPPPPAP